MNEQSDPQAETQPLKEAVNKPQASKDGDKNTEHPIDVDDQLTAPKETPAAQKTTDETMKEDAKKTADGTKNEAEKKNADGEAANKQKADEDAAKKKAHVDAKGK